MMKKPSTALLLYLIFTSFDCVRAVAANNTTVGHNVYSTNKQRKTTQNVLIIAIGE